MKEILETIVKEELAGAETETLKEGVVLAARELDEAELAAQEALTTGWLEREIDPVVFDAGGSRKEGLSACTYKCITSYLQPPNLAKGIGTKNPHSPNSSVGHT